MIARVCAFVMAASISALLACPAAAQSVAPAASQGEMQGPPAPEKPSPPPSPARDPAQVEGSVPIAVTVPSDAISRVTVYGSDPCPRGHGDEIVVCAREPESERYRVPKKLRDMKKAGIQSWADRATQLEYVGASGIQSCSPAGAGGWTGCQQKLLNQAWAERKQNKAEAATIP